MGVNYFSHGLPPGLSFGRQASANNLQTYKHFTRYHEIACLARRIYSASSPCQIPDGGAGRIWGHFCDRCTGSFVWSTIGRSPSIGCETLTKEIIEFVNIYAMSDYERRS